MSRKIKATAFITVMVFILSLFNFIGYAVDYSKFETVNAEVTLDGTNPGTAKVYWISNDTQQLYSWEGFWSLTDLEGKNKLSLTGLTSEIVEFTGFNFADVDSGKTIWKDSTFSNPLNLVDGSKLLTATYTVAADTPAGTYTVEYRSDVLTGADYNPDTTVTYYKAKITVKHADTPPTPTVTVIAIPTAKTGLVYNGSVQQGVANGTGYTLSGHTATNAGSYKAIAALQSGYKWNDDTVTAKEISWSIAKANPTVTDPTGLTGTKGNALSTVTLPTGWTWKAPATVMNTKGNQSFAAVYTPTDTANYNTKEATLTVKVSEPSVTHPTKPTINVTGTYTYNGADQTAIVTGYDSATMNITGNVGKNAGSYTVSVTSKTGKWADGTTAAVTKAWSIAKANPTVTDPTGLTGTKGNALSTVTLPTGWTWKAPATVMNTKGNQNFAAVYTPTDTANYNTKEATLTVKVSEPSVTHPTKPTINVTGTYTYNGADQTATVTGYDSATMNITGNVGKNAGSYTVSVTSKTGKWADGTTAAVTKAWSIAKANPTVTDPTGLTGTKGNALSTVTLPTGWTWKAPATVMNTKGNQSFAAVYTPTDTANYNTKEASLTVKVSEPSVTHPTKPTINVTGTYTYNGADQTATVTGYDSATMNITGNVGKNAGSYTVSVTSKTGKWADGTTAAVTKAWSIAKANPTGEPKYTAVTTSGKTLADAALTTVGANFSVPGSVKWVANDGSTLPNTTTVTANTSYRWLFTPTDSHNYETLSGTIELYCRVGGGTVTVGTIRYTVTFNTDGGSTVADRTVTRNDTLNAPTAPTKDNYIFAGWYTDKELNTRYDFSKKVTKSFMLFAKWIEKDNSGNQIILTIGQTEAKVFGQIKTNDVAPIISNNRTMLPARFVAENLGAAVSWDNDKQSVTVTGQNGVTILITIGAESAVVNGEEVKLDSPAFIENNRTYTPVRFISEQLGAEVVWNETEQKVIITKNAAENK